MKLNPREVDYTELLLDPQNPRLSTCFSGDDSLDLSEPESCQLRIEERFRVTQERSDVQRETDRLVAANGSEDEEESDDDFFSVKDLKDSMRRIGFVGIQNIIVREHAASGKYIVLEGNRRVAAIRSLIREHDAAIVGSTAYISDESLLNSLKTIKVMVFDTESRSEEIVRNEISTMLGLRHYGSQLKWDLLPRAKNIYDEYMKLLAGEVFTHTSGKDTQVAATLAIKPAEVQKLLRGYLCYKQLAMHYEVKPHHFSLILAAAETPGLRIRGHEYIEIDSSTFELGNDTPEKFDAVCEFSERDNKDYSKIVRDPKEFRKLGQIMKDSITAPEASVKGMAIDFFEQVINREISLDDAYTQLLGFKKRLKWVPELRRLLEKQSQDQETGGDLSLEKFIGEGQQRRHLESLSPLVRRFMLLMEIET